MQPAHNMQPFNEIAIREGWAAICDRSLAFERPELNALLAVWREKAAGSLMPPRTALTARILKPYLSHIAIYERVASATGNWRYRVRLMGTQFTQVMGDLTGKFIDEAIPKQFLPRWNAALDEPLNICAPVRFLSRSDTTNMSYLVAEYFSAPLLGDNGHPNIIFSAGYFSAEKPWSQVAEETTRKRASQRHT
jgi:hypothetical protein